MQKKSKTEYLKSLPIFKSFPDDRLEELLNVLSESEYKKNDVIFEEGSRGNSLYLIASGAVRVEKRLDAAGQCRKQLARFGPGDFFGEMALVENQARSASASAEENSVILKLEKDELFKWIEKQPVTAVSFFVEMVRVMSQRLRHTSSELTMLFELSRLALQRHASPKIFMVKALEEMLNHMDGSASLDNNFAEPRPSEALSAPGAGAKKDGTWSACAYLYNQFNDEFEVVHSTGEFMRNPEQPLSPSPQMDGGWDESSSFRLIIPGSGIMVYRLLFNKTIPNIMLIIAFISILHPLF